MQGRAVSTLVSENDADIGATSSSTLRVTERDPVGHDVASPRRPVIHVRPRTRASYNAEPKVDVRVAAFLVRDDDTDMRRHVLGRAARGSEGLEVRFGAWARTRALEDGRRVVQGSSRPCDCPTVCGVRCVILDLDPSSRPSLRGGQFVSGRSRTLESRSTCSEYPSTSQARIVSRVLAGT